MTESVRLHPAVKGCVEACLRCGDAADRFARADAFAAVGPHLRHCLEHVTCFLEGLNGGMVDYDARRRDAVLETDPVAFRQSMASAVAQLNALDPVTFCNPLRTRQIPAMGEAPAIVDSTVERELLFISSHAIHHLAVIAVIAEKWNVPIPETLSVAYSTAAYRALLAETK